MGNSKSPAHSPHWVRLHHRRRRPTRQRTPRSRKTAATIAEAQMAIRVGHASRCLLDSVGAAPAWRSRARTPARSAPTDRPKTRASSVGDALDEHSGESDCILHERLPVDVRRSRGPGNTDSFYAGDRMIADIRRRPRRSAELGFTYVVVAKLAEGRRSAAEGSSAGKSSWERNRSSRRIGVRFAGFRITSAAAMVCSKAGCKPPKQ